MVTVHTLLAQPPSARVEHCHDRPAVLWSIDAAVTVRTRSGFWLLPPGPVLWLPAWTRFRVEAPRPTTVHAFYTASNPDAPVERPAAVLGADTLLTAILAHVRARGGLSESTPDRRLASVLLDRLREAQALPLLVRTPPASPAVSPAISGRPLRASELTDREGACRRTVERAFARETGLSPGAWLRQTRLTRAVELLAQGHAVKDVALAIGYRTPSAFVAAFKRAMGTTPGRYLG